MKGLNEGRIVQYRLTQADVDAILARRALSHGLFVGNVPSVGDRVPLVISRLFDDSGNVNGQLLLDGNDSRWVCSVPHFDPQQEPLVPVIPNGCWTWPDRT